MMINDRSLFVLLLVTDRWPFVYVNGWGIDQDRDIEWVHDMIEVWMLFHVIHCHSSDMEPVPWSTSVDWENTNNEKSRILTREPQTRIFEIDPCILRLSLHVSDATQTNFADSLNQHLDQYSLQIYTICHLPDWIIFRLEFRQTKQESGLTDVMRAIFR